jgi:hypothetical protein
MIRTCRLGLALVVASTTVVTATPAIAAPPAAGAAFHVDPGTALGNPAGLNLAGGPGRLTIAPKKTYALGYPATVTLAQPAAQFRGIVVADVPAGASVEVDLRGRLHGGWTEWRQLPTALPDNAASVQLRLILTAASTGADPVVRDVTVVSEPLSGNKSSRTNAPLTYTAYATREGLVGGTTANGHVITNRDHFVSLPSWRSLAARGTGDYSVRVCGNGRCVYEPVWDVGPWNTRDDYWNGGDREQWKDLPQGTPEAQAAYQNRYNNGKDQFGRTVLNPAGIDLADGTIWDGLAVSGGSVWVAVSYLWTGTGTQGRVATSGDVLNVRSGPGTGSAIVGMAGPYARLAIECRVAGQTISGAMGTTNLWDRVGPGNYVSQAYVAIDSGIGIPSC